MIDQVSMLPPTTILVVEDEPLLRELAVEFIEAAGFVALEAGNADQAVILLETRSDIVAVVTDVNMPGSMDGMKLAHIVRERWPPIGILVASGKLRPRPCDLPSNCVFLAKPYLGATMVAELLALVDPLRNPIRCGTRSARIS
jgi:CheY-like chemotaxis protein